VTGAAADHSVRRFDVPERVLEFEGGRIEVITVGGVTLAKGSFAPGWRWSDRRSERPRSGKAPRFAGVVLSGRARVRAGDGTEFDVIPGDFFHSTTEDDCWVVGYRPCEILYLAGVEALIERAQQA
jgi:hypothetical protein